MPNQEYFCPNCGPYDVHLSFKDDVQQELTCTCGATSYHVLRVPAGGIHVKRDWNEKANDYQRDPYTQAKAQLTNAYNSARDRGQDIGKPTEEGIQVAAAGIAREKTRPRPDLERQHVAAAQRASRKKLVEQK